MIAEPICWKRKCRHLIGVKNDGDERTERNYCEAFPDGIPKEIAYGNNKHFTVHPKQENDIIYEREK